MAHVGQRLGSLRIDRPLGEGGMGEVFLGFDEKLERRVAVKTLHPEYRLEAESKSRLLREARLLSKIGHPAICQIYDLIETSDADYLVLEYVDGVTLRDRLRRPIAFELALDCARQIADGLVAAHREQIIHRDLKLENVMITDAGRVKILDFGVARPVGGDDRTTPAPPTAPAAGADPDATALYGAPSEAPRRGAAFRTRVGTVVGTVACMSPEQARGEKLSTASDLYSFGILLQELFTRESPYPDLPLAELWLAVKRGTTRRASGLFPDLERLIEELKSRDPALRPTAEDASERLGWIAGEPARRRRRRLFRIAAAAAFVALFAGLVATAWLAQQARTARNEAERRQGQAETLIGFMLDDLRPKLEREGRLDLLDAVGDRALAYFESIPESELSVAELARRVDALRQVGEVRMSAGASARAIEAGRRAVEVGRALVARAPDDVAGRVALARAHSALGAALLDAVVDSRDVLAEFEAALAQARAAHALAPADGAVRRQLAAALSDLGVGLQQARRFAEAADKFGESLALLPPDATAALATESDVRVAEERSTTLAWTSSTLETLGRLAEATEVRKENLAILERLAARTPDDRVIANDLATARDYHARLLLLQGRSDEALAEQRRTLAVFDQLARDDPGNAEWERSAAIARGNLGWILSEAGELEAARDELVRARALLMELRRRDPSHRTWARQEAVAAQRIAAVSLELGDRATARRELATALTALAALHAESSGDATAAWRFAEALALEARLADDAGHEIEAARVRARGLEVLAPILPAEGASPPLTLVWAELLLGQGRLDEVRPIVALLRASGYRWRRLEAMVARAGI